MKTSEGLGGPLLCEGPHNVMSVACFLINRGAITRELRVNNSCCIFTKQCVSVCLGVMSAKKVGGGVLPSFFSYCRSNPLTLVSAVTID